MAKFALFGLQFGLILIEGWEFRLKLSQFCRRNIDFGSRGHFFGILFRVAFGLPELAIFPSSTIINVAFPPHMTCESETSFSPEINLFSRTHRYSRTKFFTLRVVFNSPLRHQAILHPMSHEVVFNCNLKQRIRRLLSRSNGFLKRALHELECIFFDAFQVCFAGF